MAFLQPNFSTVCYVSVLMMLQSQDAICIHICTWPNVKSVYQIFRSGCTHVLALSFTLTMCVAFNSITFISNSKLSSIFWSETCVMADLQIN